MRGLVLVSTVPYLVGRRGSTRGTKKCRKREREVRRSRRSGGGLEETSRVLFCSRLSLPPTKSLHQDCTVILEFRSHGDISFRRLSLAVRSTCFMLRRGGRRFSIFSSYGGCSGAWEFGTNLFAR